MSAICGIFNFDGRPVSTADMEIMMAALAHRGGDGSGIMVDGPVGLGQQMFHVTPESLSEKLPLRNSVAQLIITGDIRLDNRDDLFSALGIAPADRDMPCSQLALKAYEKWGTDLVDHVEGAFAMVIWDGKEKKLHIFTDPTGMRPLFYYHNPEQFIFATEIKAVVALPAIPRELDKKFLATQLAVPFASFAFPEKTFFANISALTAASIMTVEVDGIKQRRYWTPDISRRLTFKNEADWVAAFQDLFSNVVGAGMRSAFPVASLLSGGLDSSLLTAVAAKVLEEKGQRLHTFSAVLPDGYAGSGTDERYYIDQFKSFPNIDMEYITAAGRGPFDDLENLVHGGEMPFYTSRHYLYSAFAEAAQKIGARVLLDGCFGEMGPSFHGNGYLAELLLKGRLLTLGREVVLKARREKRKIGGIIKGEVIRPIIPLSLQERFRPRFDATQMSQNLPVKKEFIDKWITKTEIKAIHDELRPLFYVSPNHRKNQASIFLREHQCLNSNGFNGYETIAPVYPFAERRIVEFCLASPGLIKVKNGYKRYMIRAAMANLAPETIRWRTDKEPFSPDFHDRYNRQKQIAADILAGIGKANPVREVIDPDRIKQKLLVEMKNNHCSTDSGFTAMHVIPKTVYLCKFLQGFNEF